MEFKKIIPLFNRYCLSDNASKDFFSASDVRMMFFALLKHSWCLTVKIVRIERPHSHVHRKSCQSYEKKYKQKFPLKRTTRTNVGSLLRLLQFALKKP